MTTQNWSVECRSFLIFSNSIEDSSQLKIDFLLKTFIEITDTLSEEVGIEFFKDRFNFKKIDKGNGKFSAQGKIHYNGPLRRKCGVATIKLDLTTDEILVLKPVIKSVHHPYTDAPQGGIKINCYAFERDANHAKAYSISKIQNVEVTNTPYIEKYPVEISSTGTISMPPIRRKTIGSFRTLRSPRISGYRPPKHKYQCPICDRYFYRKNRNSKLKKHNDKDGYPCYGRSAIYIGYE